jgi:hypothetical protein
MAVMKEKQLKRLTVIVVGLISIGCLLAVAGYLMADDHYRGRGKRWYGHESKHGSLFRKAGDRGNETAGQIAAWLLAAANIPVVMSFLIKGVNRFVPLGHGRNRSLADFNRFQKKRLMPIHYYVNPLVLSMVFWHWLTSCCKSTALPEGAFLLMVVVMALGILLKFKRCPKSLQKGVYQIHTQPLVFISMMLMLTIGHAIID